MKWLARHLLRFLAAVLRRWALLLEAQAEPKSSAAEQGEESNLAAVGSDLPEQRPGARGGGRMPRRPPAHWLERVRAGAPQLLRPPEERPLVRNPEEAPGASPENEFTEPSLEQRPSEASSHYLSQSEGPVERPNARTARVSGVSQNPPIHWINRARQQAPHLLRPGSSVGTPAFAATKSTPARGEDPGAEALGAALDSSLTESPRPGGLASDLRKSKTESEVEPPASLHRVRQATAPVESRRLKLFRGRGKSTTDGREQPPAIQPLAADRIPVRVTTRVPASGISREMADDKARGFGRPRPSLFDSAVASAAPRQRSPQATHAARGNRSQAIPKQASHEVFDTESDRDRWPTLPESPLEDHRDEWLASSREAERLRRLDSEQLGRSWNG